MKTRERDEVFARCLRTYGERPQADMAIEEMSELTKALLKMRRTSKDGIPAARAAIIDELADVRIMERQMELLYKCEGEVEERIDFKVQRQLNRLNSKEAEKEKEESKAREKAFGDKVWEFCIKRGVDVTFTSEAGLVDIYVKRGRSSICRSAPILSIFPCIENEQAMLRAIKEMTDALDFGMGWKNETN